MTIRAGESARAIALTDNQLLIWMRQRVHPDVPLHNGVWTFRLLGAVDPGAFARAFERLVEEAEALRMEIGESAGRLLGRLPDERPPALDLADLRVFVPTAPALQDWLAQRRRVRFRDGARLYDAALVRTADHEWLWYLNIHQIVGDAASVAILYRRLSELYRDAGGSAGRRLPSIAEYEEEQAAYRASDAYERDRAYWSRELPRCQPVVHLSERASAASDLRVARVTRHLPEGLDARSAESVCLAAYGLVLRRLAGVDRLTVGVGFGNRGICPVTLDAESAVAPVESVRRRLLAAARHCRFAPGNPGARPAYTATFTFHDASFPDFAGLLVEPDCHHSGWSTDLLALQVSDFRRSGRWRLDLDHRVGVMDRREAERLLEDVAATIAELAAVDAIRRDEAPSPLVGEGRGGGGQPTDLELFPDLVARWAAERPGATAVTGVRDTMTYSELEARANRLARALAARGVTRDGVVAICLERSADWVVAVLAAMRAGAAYLPVGPDDPPARQTGVLRSGGAMAVVSTSRLLPVDAGLPRLDLNRLGDELARLEPSRPPVAIPRQGLAYVLLTSGSTGQPKAVGVEHASLANYCAAARRAYGLRAGDRVLHFSSLTHDASVEEVCLTLACGGTVVLRSEHMLGSAADFMAGCGRLRVSVLALPTAFWHELTDHRHLDLWPELRLVIVGGENASAERLAHWCEWSRGTVPVINSYGPTETTVIVTAIGLDCADGADTGAWLPLGWPIGGAELLVLDDSLQRVPPGAVGALHVGGQCLARGYLTDAGRTAAAFLPHPFSRAPGARMYRTGDLVRLRADGHTTFVGRLDRQVKVRGYRIDPEEVVAALALHPAVGRSAVVASQRADGANALAAVAEPKPGHTVTAAELRAHLCGLVPAYMVPARFLVAPRLPTLSTGKVDQRRLGELVAAASDEEPAVAAANGLVEVATSIIGEVLETPVGPDDNFFEAGGDSLRAMRVLSRIHTASGVRVPIVDFLGEPTGAGLAAALERYRESGGAQSSGARWTDDQKSRQ